MAELNLQNLKDFVEKQLADTDCFLVGASIVGKDIQVEIDSDTRVDIDFVAGLNEKIEGEFAPEIDDYNLEVGSVGLTSPLRLPRQYKKHEGNDMEVVTRDGRKLHGVIKESDEDGFTLTVEEKVKKEGEKRPTLMSVDHRFGYGDVKSVTWELKF